MTASTISSTDELVTCELGGDRPDGVAGAERERRRRDRQEDPQRTEDRHDAQHDQQELRTVARQPDLRRADARPRLDRLERHVVAGLEKAQRRRRRRREAVRQQMQELEQVLAARARGIPTSDRESRARSETTASQLSAALPRRRVEPACVAASARRRRDRTRRAAQVSRTASAGWCWPSPSMIRMYSPVAARMPVFTAAPLPLLYGCRTTRAPAPLAWAAVSSVDPSSMTRISCQRRGGERARGRPRRSRRPRCSAGMTTETVPGRPSAVVCRRASRRSRRRPSSSMPPHPIEHILEQLARAGDRVGQQTDQDDLEADDHQHRRQNQRLDLAVAQVREEIVVEEPQRDREARRGTATEPM